MPTLEKTDLSVCQSLSDGLLLRFPDCHRSQDLRFRVQSLNTQRNGAPAMKKLPSFATGVASVSGPREPYEGQPLRRAGDLSLLMTRPCSLAPGGRSRPRLCVLFSGAGRRFQKPPAEFRLYLTAKGCVTRPVPKHFSGKGDRMTLNDLVYRRWSRQDLCGSGKL